MRRPPRRRRRLMEPERSGPRVNDRIRVTRVLVIDDEGRRLGEFMTEDAIQLARERGMDLIEVAPNARPPVCKIGDFGRIKYEQQKKEREAKKKQSTIVVKEIKLRPKTDEHDFEVKTKHARRFLEEGNKVKVTVRFRGREMAHRDIGNDRCREVAEAVEDVGVVETRPSMEGRQMFMILAPRKK